MFDDESFSTESFSTESFAFGEPIGPTPDAAPSDRRRIGMFVKRGGVGRLSRRG